MKKNEEMSGAGSVDFSELERLMELMARQGIEEFEYERAGLRIHLRKPSANAPAVTRAVAPPEIVVAGSPGAGAASHESGGGAMEVAGGGSAAGALRDDNLHVIKSPIVGTFYVASGPDSPPFVKVGDHVEAGKVLCIVEAMKLMNEIESDVAGEVMRIFVQNGQPVEYGEPLFAIHPQRKK
jgi:acetyl-CoA carboxylase biotin carboxyl carrier protein